MPKPKILIGPSTFAVQDRRPLERLLQAGFDVVDNPYRRKLTKVELCALLAEDVVGIVAGLEPLDREVLERSKLRAISRCGSGMSNVDTAAAAALGIAVFSTPMGPVTAVAELVIGALLSLLRSVPAMDRALHAKQWDKRIGWQLAGKQVTIIGCGRIGRRVGKLARAFEAQVIGVDPQYHDQVHGIPIVSFEEGLRRADIVSLHCSGESCRIGAKELAMMKSGVFVLNAARGGLIDEQALVQALRDGTVAGAFLDTFSREPYNGPLCESDRVILTPHVGSYTAECRSQMELEAVDNLLSALTAPGQSSREALCSR
jgi:D-3-phosphoglycerate dehydrogenase